MSSLPTIAHGLMSLNIQSPEQSVSERRGQVVTPLQTNFSRPTSRQVADGPALAPAAVLRPQRPRPPEYQNEREGGERIPLQQAIPVKRQTSKSGLRSLFGREKPVRKRSHDSKLSEIDEQNPVTQTVSLSSDTPLSPTGRSTPNTVVSMSNLLTSPTTEDLRREVSRDDNTKPTPGDPAWKPPPLFQAYPQAIKHDCLWAPVVSADSILRIHANTKASENGASAEQKEDKEKKHTRSMSETIGKMEWSQRIYVLATSGYILQYSGSGKYDRLPEKMLQLGPKSVAFASDAIPGKRWVLQVSHSSEEDGTTSIDPARPLFSRLGFNRSHARRWTRCLLLVFSNPDEMSSWLFAVRSQIEARGGKKYVSETLSDDDMEHQLRPRPSVRHMVQKDPNRFSAVFLQPQQSAGSDESELGLSNRSRRSSYVSLHRQSMVFQPPIDSLPSSPPTTYIDRVSPVNGPARFYTSNPAPGAHQLPSSDVDGSGASHLSTPQSPTSTGLKNRQSMYLPNMSVTAAEAGEIPRSHSAVPEPVLRSASPPAPNFSVPSFSRRFASRAAQAQIPQAPRTSSEQSTFNDHFEPFCAFPSPPLSPTYSMKSIEQQLALHETPLDMQLHVSNSEDSLADPPQRNQDHKGQPISFMPITTTTVPSVTQRISMVKRPSIETQALQLPTGMGDPSSRHDPQGSRISALNQTNQTGRSLSIARRKSMPGLSVGPPVAPPPDCPLPKLPSPVESSSEHSFRDPSSPTRLCKSPPLNKVRDVRKNFVNKGPHTTHTPGMRRQTRAVSGN